VCKGWAGSGSVEGGGMVLSGGVWAGGVVLNQIGMGAARSESKAQDFKRGFKKGYQRWLRTPKTRTEVPNPRCLSTQTSQPQSRAENPIGHQL